EKEGSEKEGEPEVETVWTYNKTKAENSKVNSVLGSVSNLSCDEYVYPDSVLNGSEQVFTLKLTGVKEHTLSISKSGNKEDEKYYGESSQTKYKFIIKKHKIDNLLNPIKELFEVKEREK
ncbi:MAG: hypothetical protein ABFR75_14685, partial [Acidobacteriota bacterium]